MIAVLIVIAGFLWFCRIEDRENARFMASMRERFGDDLED